MDTGIGNFLKSARKRQKFTQQDVAKLLDRHLGWVNRLERETIGAPHDRVLLDKMATVYNVDLTELELRAGLIPSEYLQVVSAYPETARMFLDTLVKSVSKVQGPQVEH